MFKVAKLIRLLLLSILVVSASCSSRSYLDAMQLFVERKDTVVMRQEKIQEYLSPSSGVNLEDMKEISPDVEEYFLVDKVKIFVPVEKKCRFVFIVQKSTGTIIGWRYNGKPEYCTSNR